MKTDKQSHGRINPLRVIDSMIRRMRIAREKFGDCGGLLETDVLSTNAARLRANVADRTVEAAAIVSQVGTVEDTVAEITSPTSEGGALITPSEHRRLALKFSQLNQTARQHHASLNELKS